MLEGLAASPTDEDSNMSWEILHISKSCRVALATGILMACRRTYWEGAFRSAKMKVEGSPRDSKCLYQER